MITFRDVIFLMIEDEHQSDTARWPGQSGPRGRMITLCWPHALLGARWTARAHLALAAAERGWVDVDIRDGVIYYRASAAGRSLYRRYAQLPVRQRHEVLGTQLLEVERVVDDLFLALAD